MDIEQSGELVDDTPGGQLVLPSEAGPGQLFVLPQDNRPFFPGQAMPLVLDATAWAPTISAMREANQDVIGLIATRGEPGNRRPSEVHADELFDIGTLCRIHRVHEVDGQLQVLLEGVSRFRVRTWISKSNPLRASIRYPGEPSRSEMQSPEVKAYAVAIINMIKELIPLNPLYGEELKAFLNRFNPNQATMLADFAAALTSASKTDLQTVLDTLDLLPRLEKVVELLHRELEIAKAQMDIREHIEGEIQGHQREAFLRQQLKFISEELGLSKDDKTNDLDTFAQRLKGVTLPEAAAQRIEEEQQKLKLLEPGSPEYGVVRNYLEWLTSLPWGTLSQDTEDLDRAEATLHRHHEGLEDVKERIVEFLAMGLMKGDVAGSIICLVGPPGVGKTSLGKAVAEALNRKFYRFSVGGMRDEAEIKGHRRTYIGALPGRLVQALKTTAVSNPVIMLDEIDKVGASFQGDPASALLEALDPEQNDAFTDNYLEVPIDLSKALFICTANQLDTIPGPLLDRMEVIQLSGYVAKEKQAIARKHLWPRALRRAGLKQRGDLHIEASALKLIVEDYAREAGVRRLDKHLATIVRKSVTRLLRGAERPIRISKSCIADLLGEPPFQLEAHEQGVGIVTGLAWTAMGGATLPVEVTRVHSQAPGLKLTGQLGDVMQESASIALSYIRANADQFGIHPEFFTKAMLHMHVPAGATPKDGPSAGVTMASALLSLGLDKAPRAGFAMTGELTLTGKVYPIGGVQEKLLAAKRQGLKKVILPAANEAEFKAVPEHIRKGFTVHFAASFEDIVGLLF